MAVDRGFKAGDNVVTVQSVLSISPPTYSGGPNALDHLETIAEIIGRRVMGQWAPIAASQGRFFPLFVMSPSVAQVIARGGWTKDDIRQYLYENVKGEAGFMEKLAWQAGSTSFTYCRAVEQGFIGKEFCE